MYHFHIFNTSNTFFEHFFSVPGTCGPIAVDVETIVNVMRAIWGGSLFELDLNVSPMPFDDKVSILSTTPKEFAKGHHKIGTLTKDLACMFPSIVLSKKCMIIS